MNAVVIINKIALIITKTVAAFCTYYSGWNFPVFCSWIKRIKPPVSKSVKSHCSIPGKDHAEYNQRSSLIAEFIFIF